MNRTNITIVGAGNSGCAHACQLSMAGYNVRIFKTSHSLHDENFNQIAHAGGIKCIDNTNNTSRFVTIDKITRDPAVAFENADYVLVLTQSLQHKDVAKRIAPYIQGIKGLLIVPGNMGSMYFRPLLPASVIIAEGESTIVDARINAPGSVTILFRNVRNALSFNPSKDAERGFKEFQNLIPNYTGIRSNVVETAMHNPNLIVHTVGSIMSASRIEMSHGEFWMYRESFSPSVWNIIDALDAEKNAVIKAYGGQPQSYLECCKWRNEESLDVDAKEVFNRYAYNGSPKGPANLQNRYILEDVPNGLCLLQSLAQVANIKTPVADSLITLAGVLLNRDLKSESRSVEELGLPESVEKIKEML